MNLAINQSLVEMGSSVVRFLDVLMIGKSRVVLVVLLMLCSMVPFNISAADSGGILASSDTMSYSPLNPSAGDSIEITLTLSITTKPLLMMFSIPFTRIVFLQEAE